MNEAMIILLITIVGVILASVLLKKEYVGYIPILLIIVSLMLPIFFGMGIRIREIVEGPFAYYDILLSVICANLFIYSLYRNGTLEKLLLNTYNSNDTPLSKSIKTSIFVGLPAMLTGLASTSILTTGKIFKNIDKSDTNFADKTKFINMASFIGLIAPPFCLPAMIIVVSRSGSYPTSFEGYFIPMLLLSIPAILLHGFKNRKLFEKEISERTSKVPYGTKLMYIPLIVVLVLILAHNFLYKFVPFLGYPLIYILGLFLSIVFAPRKINVVDVLLESITKISMPLSYFIAMGSLLEIITMLGVTGTLSTILAETNMTLLGIILLIITLSSGLIFGYPLGFFIGLLASYIIGAVSWTGIAIPLLGIGIISCIPQYSTLIINDYTKDNRFTTSFSPIIIFTFLICLIFIIFGSNLEMLMI